MLHLPEKHLILFYNLMWDGWHDFNQLSIPEECILTTDHAYIAAADVIVFHMPTLKGDESIRKREGQLWVFWSMECEDHYPLFRDPKILGLFDIYMTYRSDADVQVPYLLLDHKEKLRQRPAKKEYLANAFISSPLNLSKRNECLKELMSLIKVHSYGKMFNNSAIRNDNGFKAKMDIISSYKFTLAFENAIAKDYVTEKFYDPLIAGSVPVYLGAPNIEEFAPGDKCYINLNSFGSLKELAEYLLMLDANEQQYREYLSWKDRPFRPLFVRKIEERRVHPFVRLCYVVIDRLRNKQQSVGEMKL